MVSRVFDKSFPTIETGPCFIISVLFVSLIFQYPSDVSFGARPCKVRLDSLNEPIRTRNERMFFFLTDYNLDGVSHPRLLFLEVAPND